MSSDIVSPKDLPRNSIDAGPLEWVDEHLTDSEEIINLNNNWNEEQYDNKDENDRKEAREARDELQQSEERPKSGLSWWKKVTDKIKYTIIAPETETAFLDIYELAKELLKGMGFRPIDISTSIMILSTFHKNLNIHTDLVVTDIDLAARLHRASLFASAAYGWKLLTFSTKSAKTFYSNAFAEAANEKILLDLTGVKKEDIVVARWHTCKKFSPGHFIVLDHADKSVVLCVRGTFHYRDCLTDLSAKYYPYKGGYAHYGILCAAKQLAEDVTPILIEQLKKNPGYKLIVIGHSLGAGTASLLATLLHDEYNIDLHCYALAPPCVLSLDLAAQCSSFITSVIVNDDIIPRLCWGSIHDLKECLIYLLDQKDGTLGRSDEQVGGYLKVSPTPDLGTKKFSERLYPPGTCYHIYKSSKAWGAKYDMMERSSPSMFSDIVISNTMFMDHMPDLYERAIKRSLDRLIKLKESELTTQSETLEQHTHISPPPTISNVIDGSLPKDSNQNNYISAMVTVTVNTENLIDLSEPTNNQS